MGKLGPQMKKAFTLAEVLIVVAILGILAAIILPEFQDHTRKARETAAMDNIRAMRQQIGFYAHRNDVPLGYPGNNPTQPTDAVTFVSQMVDGGYLNKIPDNPMTEKAEIKIIQDADVFPAAYTPAWSGFDWIYQAGTAEIRLHAEGTDPGGIAYFDY